MRDYNSRRPGRLPLIFLSVVSLLLCLALIYTVVDFQSYKSSTQETIAVFEQNEEDLVQTTIPIETFQQYADQFGVSVEFIQQFFPDKIVYKDAGGTVYVEIDESLPKHNYDWGNLVSVNGRYEYQENGVSTAAVGIDVSKHQGKIDWKRVKAAGIDFAIIRMGNRGYGTGKLVVDETFEENARGALEAGVDIGVYFFSQAINVEEALEEANLMLDAIREFDIAYPVVFDTEAVADSSGRINNLPQEELTNIAIAFCNAVKDAGYRPMIYANVKWFVTKLDLSRLGEYDKWVAQYFRKPYFPYEFQMWQYSGSGKVDGIEGDVDLNLCFADYTKKSAAQTGTNDAASGEASS